MNSSNYTQVSKTALVFAVGVALTALSLVQVVPEGNISADGSDTAFVEQFVPVDEAPVTDTGEEQVAEGPTRRVIQQGGTEGLQGTDAQQAQVQGADVGGQAGGSGECAAGKNGGSTDTGISGTEIKLGATVAESGIARDFLGEVRQAMEAVKKRVNGSGGICGRNLTIIYKDDGWDAARGKTFIENLIHQDKVFALAVVPSSEGLNEASKAGVFKSSGVPVVGSDGMIKTQYTDDYIWPVATSTTTLMHVMLKEAWDRCKNTEGCGTLRPAIVYENTYKFGVEGANAFNQAYKRLSGENIPGFDPNGGQCNDRYCGIPSGSQYGNQVNTLNTKCDQDTKCNFIALLLEPKTAQDFMAVTGAPTPSDPALKVGMGAAQPLFTRKFGVNCGDKCNGMWLWTGYNPPIEQFRSDPKVTKYVDELKSVSASADENNQFTEGGYLGMLLLEEALKKVGPELTRDALMEALDSITLDTGLSPKLTWSKGKHFANNKAQAFAILSQQGFRGWEFKQDYIEDPWLGQDV